MPTFATAVHSAAKPAAKPSPAAQPAPPCWADFVRFVAAGSPRWVEAALLQTTAELASSAQDHAVAGQREHTASVLAVLQGPARAALLKRLLQAVADKVNDRVERGADGMADGADSGPLTLTLIDESQIDEDIEIARAVQSIESESEAELQQLSALCSSLRGLDHVNPAAHCLGPLQCAHALRESLQGLTLNPGGRLLLLRHLGRELGLQMKRAYAEQAAWLLQRGIKPAAFRVRQSVPVAPRRAADAQASSLDAPTPTLAALWKLVQQAQGAAAEDGPQDDSEDDSADDSESGNVPLRLLSDPRPAGSGLPALDAAAAERLMQRLMVQLAQVADLSPAARRLLSSLHQPGQQLAAAEPGLWSNLQHPWWTMLDRLMAIGSVHDDSPQPQEGAVTAALGLLTQRMQLQPPQGRQDWQATADEIQALSVRQLDESQAVLHSALQSQTGDIEREADARELEADLRNQIVQQLRSTPVCAALRHLLVGPWTLAMARVAVLHGMGSPALTALADAVDDLIRATARPGRAVSAAQRAVLLRQVRQGLAQADLPDSRVEAELVDLERLLRDPPEVEPESWAEPVDTLPAGLVLDLHAGLPTVPISMGPAGPDSQLEAGVHCRQSWLQGLKPGDYGRLFLQGRWVTAQLSWISDSRNLFMFTSRHGGRAHSLTARMLDKLRSAGLATTIEDGYLLAQAMDTLADSSLAP